MKCTSTRLQTLLEIFCEFILDSEVIFNSGIDPDNKYGSTWSVSPAFNYSPLVGNVLVVSSVFNSYHAGLLAGNQCRSQVHHNGSLPGQVV